MNIKLIAISSVALFLVACGDGASINGTGTSVRDTATTDPIVLPTADVPAHCAALNYSYVKKVIGCSRQSYIDCKCYDPSNPNQQLPR